jgi:hypothetical protein
MRDSLDLKPHRVSKKAPMIILDAETPLSLTNLSSFDATFAQGKALPVAIFDFDGVLCAPTEDLVYKLPEQPGERDRLTAIGRRYGLIGEIYDVPYLRHLLLQAILSARQMVPETGPMLPLARALTDAGRPFFVLTARSGQAAIERALGAMNSYGLVPQEIFCVGRVAKGRQLAVVRETLASEVPIVYFDDSIRHIRNSHAQDVDGLETVHVAWKRPDRRAAEDLLADCIDWAQAQSIDRRAA